MVSDLLTMGRARSLDDIESNQEYRSSTWCDWTFVVLCSIVGYTCIVLTVLACFNPELIHFDISSWLFCKEISPFFAFSQGNGHYSKPQGFKIVALVPFHYHERTAILECYLQRNLAHNDGFLDRVIFVPQTENAISMEWLNSIVDRTPDYAIASEESLTKNVMYIRIDGDTVFLEDNTIPTIVKTKLDNPRSLVVSANVINEAALASFHSHPGTTFPYLPELHVGQPTVKHDWRASSLPSWQGPLNFKVHKNFEPPFEGHRWLLSNDGSSGRDPIAASVYTETGPTLQDWTVGAQQHYSFLHHLENSDLGRYKFPLWVNPTESISKNFGCFWGNDGEAVYSIFQGNQSSPTHDWHKPDGAHPHVVIDGKGVVSHYSARQGEAGLDATDLIDRYQAYAQERVCLPTA